MSRSDPPAIVRANNPCALRPLAKGAWRGQSGTIRTSGGLYCRFVSPVMGVRAGLRNLATYRRVHGLRTPRQIVARWAPARDRNPEAAYAAFIARRLGIGPADPIPATFEANRRLIAAIVRFECGFDAVDPATVAQAMALVAAEEEAAGRDPAPWQARGKPLKPLTRSKEVALGGGAAATGLAGAAASAREAAGLGRETARTLAALDPWCLGAFAVLALVGTAILVNRLVARFRAER